MDNAYIQYDVSKIPLKVFVIYPEAKIALDLR